MNRATPKMRDFAEHLIAYETSRNKSTKTKTPAAFSFAEKLRAHLAALMGNVGFRSLLSRALALANAEVAWLRAVHVKADGPTAFIPRQIADLQAAAKTDRPRRGAPSAAHRVEADQFVHWKSS